MHRRDESWATRFVAERARIGDAAQRDLAALVALDDAMTRLIEALCAAARAAMREPVVDTAPMRTAA